MHLNGHTDFSPYFNAKKNDSLPQYIKLSDYRINQKDKIATFFFWSKKTKQHRVNHIYLVKIMVFDATVMGSCGCPDFINRGRACKHILCCWKDLNARISLQTLFTSVSELVVASV